MERDNVQKPFHEVEHDNVSGVADSDEKKPQSCSDDSEIMNQADSDSQNCETSIPCVPEGDQSGLKTTCTKSNITPSHGSTSLNIAESKENEEDDMKNVYHIKWIEWSEQTTPIVTQNENGPCPLLAIFNFLLLSKRTSLPDSAEFISSTQIISRIADIVWEAMPVNLQDDERLNYEQNMSDAMAVFPNLQTGLDVNVRFDAVSSFEYTPELTVFDLLQIPLYHGWLVDPQDSVTKEVLGALSYNQVVEKVINYTSSDKPEEVNKGLIVQEFLESTASQITYHGIVSLLEEMRPGSLAVLFRNNHFCTIHRHNDELFTLITDFGFLKEQNVVWESLSSVQGDSQFVDGKFFNSPPKCENALSASEVPNTDHDYELALSMQQAQVASSSSSGQPRDTLSDFELARRLQEQENAAQQASVSQSQHPPRPRGHPASGSSSSRTASRAPVTNRRNESNESKCVIL